MTGDQKSRSARRLSARRRIGRPGSCCCGLELGHGSARRPQCSKRLPGAKRLFLSDAHGARALSASPACCARTTAPVHAGGKTVCSMRCSIRRRWRSNVPTSVERVDEAQVLAEAESCEGAMLTSLSHDLRARPGLHSWRRDHADRGPNLYDAKQTDELLATIREEAERLDRFARQSARHVAETEAGVLGVKPESMDVTDWWRPPPSGWPAGSRATGIVNGAPADLPLVSADSVALEQAIFNLLDNAVKYAPAGPCIRVRGPPEGKKVYSTIRMRVPAFRRRIWPTSLTNSIAQRPRTGGLPVLVWVLRWREGLLKPSAAASKQPIGWIEVALS